MMDPGLQLRLEALRPRIAKPYNRSRDFLRALQTRLVSEERDPKLELDQGLPRLHHIIMAFNSDGPSDPFLLGAPQELRIQSTSDSLTHPLLSSPQTPQHIRRPSSEQSIPDPLASSSVPKYVPYTPRQRVQLSTPTTSTSVQASAASASTPASTIPHGGATGKLQLQNLKAAAQAVGLSNGSVGWAMLEKFTGDASLGDWEQAWGLITTGKATLLLPAEPLSGQLDTSADFIKEHVVFCSGPSSSPAPVVTLSGLRGVIEGETLTFRSSIATSSNLFASLLNPTSRSSALISAPPLPHPLNSTQSSSYPTFAIPKYAPSLPFPPRNALSVPPPLPPRSNTNRMPTPSSSTTLASASARLNPFASLFGRTGSSTSTGSAPSPTVTISPPLPPPRSSSPQPSISSASSIPIGDSPTLKPDHFSISAFIISRPIKRKQVVKDVQRATRAQVKDALGSNGAGLPNWMVSRVVDFTSSILSKQMGDDDELADANAGGKSSNIDPVTGRPSKFASLSQRSPQRPDWALDLSTPTKTVETLQDFFSALEDDITNYWNAAGSPTVLGRQRGGVREGSLGDDDDGSLSQSQNSHDSRLSINENDPNDKQLKVRRASDAVEKVVCSLFYDKLFGPEGSDDKSHDQALASRVAALNMLDLTLEHLGVEIAENGMAGVEKVVQAVGRELQRLEDPLCRSPGEKVSVLVAAHNVVVHGLASLPPIRLKPDGEQVSPVDHDKTPVVPSFPHSTARSQPGGLNPAKDVDPPASEKRPSSGIEPTPATDLTLPVSPAKPKDSDTNSVISSTSATDLVREAMSTSVTDMSIATVVPDVLSNTPSRSQSPTPVSSDILLPILIYSVVKSNPPQLVSHVLYTQRYRHRSASGGEEGFCLINIMAVAEFLENVDMTALGLTETDRVSIADLDPIPIPADASVLAQPPTDNDNFPLRLRGRVEQQVGELAGSANKVLTGVVDSSFSALRGFLGHDAANAAAAASNTQAPSTAATTSPTTNSRQGFGLLRRGSGFSIASVAASLPAGLTRDRRNSSAVDQSGQQLMEVPSRPGSIRSQRLDEDSGEDETSEAQDESDEDSGDEEESDGEGDARSRKSDVRSIRSFGSMMSEAAKEERKPRKSLTDRLANVSARLTVNPASSPSRDGQGRKYSPPNSRRASLLVSPRLLINSLPEVASPIADRILPPANRFMECTIDDLKMSEIPMLLSEYRRMVEALKARDAFQDVVDLSH
ncbi:hypothetical protein FRB95_014149 [Tulasnella sp. JGI-2019a]|nr:hypothetical protein FRB95_014149 [Tulasnella sp. JGI-2019a]